MMHPFANVGGLFDEDLESWQGQFGCSIESLRVLRDRREARLRPRREVGPRARRSARSTRPSPAAPAPRSGARTTTSTSRRTWAAARTGACSARTSRTRPTRSRCPSTLTDGDGIPAPEIHYKVSENSRRLLDFHIEKASQSLLEAGRLQGRGRPAHALLGLAPAGHGPDGRRPRDLGPRPLEPHPRRRRTCTSSTARASSPAPASTRRARSCALALRAADHMVETRFEQQVPA